jgi:hypothetical protein
MEYKKRPNHIPHWNKESKEYIYSEEDEAKLRVDMEFKNNCINEFK